MTKGYHLVTAVLGHFNADTTEFATWIKQIIDLRNQIGSQAEWDAMAKLASEQVYVAIYEPDSEIGIQIRMLEYGIDPLLPGSGPEVYWEYLIQPAAEMAGRNLDWERSGFNRMVIGYEDAHLMNQPPPVDFGAYLAEIQYLQTD